MALAVYTLGGDRWVAIESVEDGGMTAVLVVVLVVKAVLP